MTFQTQSWTEILWVSRGHLYLPGGQQKIGDFCQEGRNVQQNAASESSDSLRTKTKQSKCLQATGPRKYSRVGTFPLYIKEPISFLHIRFSGPSFIKKTCHGMKTHIWALRWTIGPLQLSSEKWAFPQRNSFLHKKGSPAGCERNTHARHLPS